MARPVSQGFAGREKLPAFFCWSIAGECPFFSLPPVQCCDRRCDSHQQCLTKVQGRDQRERDANCSYGLLLVRMGCAGRVLQVVPSVTGFKDPQMSSIPIASSCALMNCAVYHEACTFL